MSNSRGLYPPWVRWMGTAAVKNGNRATRWKDPTVGGVLPFQREPIARHRRNGRFVLVGLAALLAGCAVTAPSPPEIGVALPEHFLADAPPAPVQDQWWTAFGDARLTAFVDQAVNRNPQVGQAIGQLRQAEAQARIAGADALPQVGAAFNAARQRVNLSGTLPTEGLDGVDLDIPSSFVTQTFQLNAEASWEIDLWGRISAQTAAARAEFLASAETLRAIRQSIAAEAARLYFTVTEARAQVALGEESVATVGEVARQLGNRADAGIASPGDRALADANLGSAEAGLAQSREALERTTRQLEILLRGYPAGAIETALFLPDLPPVPPAGLPAELLVRRPDVAAAERVLQAAGFRRAAAERSFLPSVQLNGSIGTQGTALGDLFGPGSFVWTIAGAVLQPIFQGGRLRAQVRQAEGAEAEALEAYAEVALRALAEVETALAVEAVLAEREAAHARAAAAADEAARIAFNRYLAGLDPFIAVIESRQRAIESRGALITSRRARLDNRIDLHLALGGGFEAGPAPAQARP